MMYDIDLLKENVEKNSKLFTDEQKSAFNQIISAVELDNSKAFFIDGFGGSGKTFLYNTLLAKVRSEGDKAIAMASSFA